MKKSVLVVMATGFEELELVAPVDLLRRAGVRCVLASCEKTLVVQGRNGLSISADCLLSELKDALFDCLLLPGGPAVQRLLGDDRVLKLITWHHEAGRVLAAICAAPLLLQRAALLPGPRHTGHESIKDQLPELDPTAAVVVDGEMITARGAGSALLFGLALVERLVGDPAARQVAASIHHEASRAMSEPWQGASR